MTAPLLDPGLVTPEQRRLLDQLTALVDEGQSRWLSGYFAGLAAGLAREVPHAGPDDTARRRLLILYGSETGNSREIAQRLYKSAGEKGLFPLLADMSDYKPRQLAQEQDIVIVVSTYGEGDAAHRIVAGRIGACPRTRRRAGPRCREFGPDRAASP